jgi:hypothetical protein
VTTSAAVLRPGGGRALALYKEMAKAPVSPLVTPSRRPMENNQPLAAAKCIAARKCNIVK